jgi:hypothetical protein
MDSQPPGRFREIGQELRTVFAGRGKIIDSLIPPLFFLILNAALGFDFALWAALGSALLIGLWRGFQRQSLVYAFTGLGGVLVAVLIAKFLGSAQGFFLPGLITGSLTAGICLISLIAQRPLAAWSSYLTRRWPLDWYWHPRVRPAYSEVTLAWMLFFSLRLLLQWLLFQRQAAQALGWVQLLTGWPALIVLLIGSYLYGLWRLGNLHGPSVTEFKAGAPPPWQSQKRGF